MNILSQSTIIDEITDILLRARKYRTLINLTNTTKIISQIALPIITSSYQKAYNYQAINCADPFGHNDPFDYNGTWVSSYQKIVDYRDVFIWHRAFADHKMVMFYRDGVTDREWDLPAVTHRFNGEIFIDFPKVMTNQEWYQNGKIHRDNDLPAVIRPMSYKQWFQHGDIHRDNDKPAAIWTNGRTEWYKHGKLHRENDLPAVILNNGTQEWHKNGLLYRDNGQPPITLGDSTQYRYNKGEKYKNSICHLM